VQLVSKIADAKTAIDHSLKKDKFTNKAHYNFEMAVKICKLVNTFSAKAAFTRQAKVGKLVLANSSWCV